MEYQTLEVQAKVDAYITRVALGGAKKNVRALKDGIFEIKIDFGPGYRVYFGEDGRQIIVLLVAGDKSSQRKDIQKAKQYWQNYEKNKTV